MANGNRSEFWIFVRSLAAPVLFGGLFVVALLWLRAGAEPDYDRAALEEWLGEARISGETLRDLVRDYVDALDEARQRDPALDPAQDGILQLKAEKIHQHLKALGEPVSKMYSQQLPLFPTVYRMQVELRDRDPAAGPPRSLFITWDSELPRNRTQYKGLSYPIHPRAQVHLHYQLHAFNKQQQAEQQAQDLSRQVLVFALAGLVPALLWVYWVQRRERDRERQRSLMQHEKDQAERLLLENELRFQETQRLKDDAERKLLEQRLATQAAEREALELKSQIYASIGIMAGSYAHNIKNLLVRPNDLLARCLDADGLSGNQEHMLKEVRQTLGTVTERLQEILRTVRRDPTRAELRPLDLNALLRDLHDTWKDLARERWKLNLSLELAPEPLFVEADRSHLQQAVENLLFNARDATFEMRSHQREVARRGAGEEGGAPDRRQALIAAAAWRGSVVLRTRREDGRAVLEVQDNGVGMSEEVRRRCTEPHFSTKRDNALYEGQHTGMGLGLSFVTVVLEHHRAGLEIDSAPLQGTTFRVRFPLADERKPLAA
jgi:signal transduction histidine kinase